MFYKKEGFTLIELLVVIAVIGLLATIVLISLSSARAKSRDARRLADLKQVSLALEMFYNEYGYYPNNEKCCNAADAGWDHSDVGGFIPGLQGTECVGEVGQKPCFADNTKGIVFMAEPVVDPINNSDTNACNNEGDRAYIYNIYSKKKYELCAVFESISDPAAKYGLFNRCQDYYCFVR